MNEFKGTKDDWVLADSGVSIFNKKYLQFKQEKKMIITGYLYSEEGKNHSRESLLHSEENKSNILLISKSYQMLELLYELSNLKYGSILTLQDKARQLIREATDLK